MLLELDAAKNETSIRNHGLSFELVKGFNFEAAIIWQDAEKLTLRFTFPLLAC